MKTDELHTVKIEGFCALKMPLNSEDIHRMRDVAIHVPEELISRMQFSHKSVEERMNSPIFPRENEQNI